MATTVSALTPAFINEWAILFEWRFNSAKLIWMFFQTRATESGVRAACSSNTWWMHRSSWYALLVSFHSTKICFLSAADKMGSFEKGWSESATIPSSNVWKCEVILMIVCVSKRSVLYSKLPVRPSSLFAMDNFKSNPAVPLSTGISVRARPGSRGSCMGTFCRTNITWKSGEWLRLRSGRIVSTSFSNGRSWWANAWRHTSRIWLNVSRKVERCEKFPLRTNVFTKNPMRFSISFRLRLATGEPTTISSWPV